MADYDEATQSIIDEACDIIAGFIRIQGSDIFWPVRDGKEFLANFGRDQGYCQVSPVENEDTNERT